MVSITSDGTIQHWHLSTGKAIHTIKNECGGDLYCLDFSPLGNYFAVAGHDLHVHVFDEATKKKAFKMRVGGKMLPGHAERI